jgi:hypothetical protein
MTESWTVSAFIVRRVLETLAARGVAIDAVLERTGISPRVMSDIELRVPYATMVGLWEAAGEVTGDPWFAVHFAERLKPDSNYPCHYVMTSSANVGEGLVRFVRYARLCAGGEETQLAVQPSQTRLVRRSVAPSPHADEFLLTFLLLRSRLATGIDWRPDHVTFQHERGTDSSELARIFRCPIAFGGPEVELRFPSAILELPHAEAHPDSSLLGLLTSNTDDLRKALPAQESFVLPVAVTIAKQMSKSLPTLSSTARELRLTERTLQRRLADAGVTTTRRTLPTAVAMSAESGRWPMRTATSRPSSTRLTTRSSSRIRARAFG